MQQPRPSRTETDTSNAPAAAGPDFVFFPALSISVMPLAMTRTASYVIMASRLGRHLLTALSMRLWPRSESADVLALRKS